jgi:hypothetical protein
MVNPPKKGDDSFELYEKETIGIYGEMSILHLPNLNIYKRRRIIETTFQNIV